MIKHRDSFMDDQRYMASTPLNNSRHNSDASFIPGPESIGRQEGDRLTFYYSYCSSKPKQLVGISHAYNRAAFFFFFALKRRLNERKETASTRKHGSGAAREVIKFRLRKSERARKEAPQIFPKRPSRSIIG
jgi:hypothetical protein